MDIVDRIYSMIVQNRLLATPFTTARDHWKAPELHREFRALAAMQVDVPEYEARRNDETLEQYVDRSIGQLLEALRQGRRQFRGACFRHIKNDLIGFYQHLGGDPRKSPSNVAGAARLLGHTLAQKHGLPDPDLPSRDSVYNPLPL